MEQFKQRLESEKLELEVKLNKLNSFIQSEQFILIDPVQKAILNIQTKAMSTYLECLKERLIKL